MQIAVVTKIPDAEKEGGNLYSPTLYVLDGGGPHPFGVHITLGIDDKIANCPQAGIENFALGEILILDNQGREIGGNGRKPGKWAVEIEMFGEDLLKAAARARGIRGW